MSQPASSASAVERAHQAVRERIVRGDLTPGTMLSESALAAELGVSRTPIRVALARLQDEGWVTIYPKRGALVQGLSARAAAELGEARLILESTSIGRAPVQRRIELADVLADLVEQQRAAFATQDVARFISLTLQFHRGFIEASDNDVLLELYDRLADRQRFMLFAAGDRLLARCADIIAEHHQLTEHMRSGDAEAFAASLRGHIVETVAMPEVAATLAAAAPATTWSDQRQ